MTRGSSGGRAINSGSIVVIQCPKCKTKFGVDAAVLGQVARPRFHCSKCDTNFSRSLASIMTALSRASIEDSRFESRSTTPEKSSTSISTPRDNEAVELESSRKGTIDFRNSVHESLMERPSVDFGDQEEEDVGLVLAKRAEMRTRSSDELVKSATEATIFSSMSITPESATPTYQRRPESVVTSTVGEGAGVFLGEQKSELKYGGEDSQANSSSSISATRKENLIVDRAKEEKKGSSVVEKQTIRRYFSPSSYLHSFVIALSPIVLVAFASVCLTLLIIQDPMKLGLVHPTLIKVPLQMAPPEVQTEGVSFKNLTLVNGDSVYVITGRVVNRSNLAFNGVQVEALTFSQDGSVMQRSRSSTGAPLTKANLTNLSLPTIQREAQKKGIRLPPQTAHEFVVVFPNHSPPPSFFSARIYAVDHKF